MARAPPGLLPATRAEPAFLRQRLTAICTVHKLITPYGITCIKVRSEMATGLQRQPYDRLEPGTRAARKPSRLAEIRGNRGPVDRCALRRRLRHHVHSIRAYDRSKAA